MKTAPVSLVCTGRALDADGQAVGEPCGRRITAYVRAGGYRGETLDELRMRARVTGWKLGPSARDVMCPQCGRPDAAMVALLRDLTRERR